ncbi:MAG: glycosyltransferase family 39 protein, partial [Ardenticatenia bacterium]|nr:glycosyltransferase family 39 protein [Ardenticatenia bacterium]
MSSARRPVLFSILVTALALRLLFLDAQPLWWDEGYSVYFSTESLSRLIELTSFDIHPPLYYVFLKAWFALVGVSPIRARLLSVLLGVLAVRLMWHVAHRLAPRPVASVATVLLAISPLHIYYSQEVRMYALLVLLTLTSVMGLLEACRTGGRRHWVSLVLLATATMLTQYYGLLIVVALALIWWWLRRSAPSAFAHIPEPRAAARWLMLLGVLYAPWALYTAPRLYAYVVGKVAIEADRPLSVGTFALRHAVAFSVGHLMPQQVELGVGAFPFVALALLGTWYGWQRAKWQVGLLLIWLWVPAVGTFLVNLIAPFTDPRIERQLIAALPPFLLLVAWGVEALRRPLPRPWITEWMPLTFRGRVAIAFAASLLLLVADALSLAGFYTIPRYPEDDYRPLLAHVAARQGPGDAWLAVYPWQIGYLRAYLPEKRPAEVAVPLNWSEDEGARRTGVRALYAQFARLWFPAFQVKGRMLEERLAATLRQEGVPVWDEWYGTTRLWLTARADTSAEGEPHVTFSGGNVLRRVAYRASPVPAGVGVVPVVLTWEGPTDNRRLSLQLVGPGGTVWGEFDTPLEVPETRAGVPVEPGTPPLRYTLRLTLYQADTGRPYDVLDAGGNPIAPFYTLGELTVTRPPAPIPTTALPIQRPMDLTFGNEVRLLGASLVTDTVQTGDTLPVVLFWRAQADVSGDYRINAGIRGGREVLKTCWRRGKEAGRRVQPSFWA